VRAMTGTLDRDIEVEDVSMALVRFANGALGTITNSILCPRQESHLRLDFQQATVEVNALYHYDNDNWRLTLPDQAADQTPLQRWQALSENIPSSHTAQLSPILDSYEHHQRPPVSGPDARRILEFTASLYKAAQTGQPVQRGTITPGDPFYSAMNGAPQKQEQK
ncbi:MAG TPA: hypothetical protein VHO69_11085, partial [Phototrophicaceae bacterium]|nr:hypothetical protein [Phototrophicaceae bacterium]